MCYVCETQKQRKASGRPYPTSRRGRIIRSDCVQYVRYWQKNEKEGGWVFEYVVSAVTGDTLCQYITYHYDSYYAEAQMRLEQTDAWVSEADLPLVVENRRCVFSGWNIDLLPGGHDCPDQDYPCSTKAQRLPVTDESSRVMRWIEEKWKVLCQIKPTHRPHPDYTPYPAYQRAWEEYVIACGAGCEVAARRRGFSLQDKKCLKCNVLLKGEEREDWACITTPYKTGTTHYDWYCPQCHEWL